MINSEVTVKRGSIYYITQSGEQNQPGVINQGRPAIVVSSDRLNSWARAIEVVFLTSRPKIDHDTHVVIENPEDSGLRFASTVLCEQVYTVNAERVGRKLGEVPEHIMERIDEALMHSLGLEKYFDESEDEDYEDDSTEDSITISNYSDELERYKFEARFYKEKYEEILDTVMNKALRKRT